MVTAKQNGYAGLMFWAYESFGAWPSYIFNPVMKKYSEDN
jgi:hypothetical protein